MRRYYLSTLGVTALLLCAVSMTAHGAAYWILEQGNATYGRAGTISRVLTTVLHFTKPCLRNFAAEFVVAQCYQRYRSFERADLVAPHSIGMA